MKYTEDMKQFYAGKRVFLTGHTGFKGSWLSVMLRLLGAEVYGYALQPESDPDLFSLLGLQDKMHSTIADIRDFARLKEAVREAKPDCVLHLAAQGSLRLGRLTLSRRLAFKLEVCPSHRFGGLGNFAQAEIPERRIHQVRFHQERIQRLFGRR